MATCQPRDLPTQCSRTPDRAGCTDTAVRVRASAHPGHALSTHSSVCRCAIGTAGIRLSGARAHRARARRRPLPHSPDGRRTEFGRRRMRWPTPRGIMRSGVIEVTNRANLQLRGVRDDAHEALVQPLLDAGLGPATPGADDLRNVMLSPLALDDTRALAARIVDRRCSAMRGFMRCRRNSRCCSTAASGSPCSIIRTTSGSPRSTVARASRSGWRDVRRSMRTMRRPSAPWKRMHVVALVDALLHAFLDLAAPEHTRMRDLLSEVPVERLLKASDVPPMRDVHAWRRPAADASLRLGAHFQHRERADARQAPKPPLGRLSASSLHALADLAATHGTARLRMTPWQSVLLPDIAQAEARRRTPRDARPRPRDRTGRTARAPDRVRGFARLRDAVSPIRKPTPCNSRNACPRTPKPCT